MKNQYTARCANCGRPVPAYEGMLIPRGGRHVTLHLGPCPAVQAPAPAEPKPAPSPDPTPHALPAGA